MVIQKEVPPTKETAFTKNSQEYLDRHGVKPLLPFQPENIRLSIVIPALNEAGSLKRLLISLELQTNQNFEVILVDNGSTDGTESIIEAYDGCLKERLFLMKQPLPGVGNARKMGMDQAVARNIPFIAGTDADTTVPDTWVENLYEAFNHISQPDLLIGGVDFSQQLPPELNNKQILRAFTYTSQANNLLLQSVRPYVYGGNFAIKTDAYALVDGIKQPMTPEGRPWVGEDRQLGEEVLAHQGRIAYVDSIVSTSPRRYLDMLISGKKAYQIEKGMTHIRNAHELISQTQQISEEAIGKFISNRQLGFFIYFILQPFSAREKQPLFWKNALSYMMSDTVDLQKMLHDFEAVIRQPITHSDEILPDGIFQLWEKYGNIFIYNLNARLRLH